MQLMQKRNPVMLATDDKTLTTDSDTQEGIDVLGVQEMKDFKIFEVIKLDRMKSDEQTSLRIKQTKIRCHIQKAELDPPPALDVQHSDLLLFIINTPLSEKSFD
jgi:hypothetical protein